MWWAFKNWTSSTIIQSIFLPFSSLSSIVSIIFSSLSIKISTTLSTPSLETTLSPPFLSVDGLIDNDENIIETIEDRLEKGRKIDCIIVDEVQFLKAHFNFKLLILL